MAEVVRRHDDKKKRNHERAKDKVCQMLESDVSLKQIGQFMQEGDDREESESALMARKLYDDLSENNDVASLDLAIRTSLHSAETNWVELLESSPDFFREFLTVKFCTGGVSQPPVIDLGDSNNFTVPDHIELFG